MLFSDGSSSWTSAPSAYTYNEYMHAVALTSTEAYAMGGRTYYNQKSTRQEYKIAEDAEGMILCRNWWVWNIDNNKWDDWNIHMTRDHYQGSFTRIPEDAAILRNCKIQNI